MNRSHRRNFRNVSDLVGLEVPDVPEELHDLGAT